VGSQRNAPAALPLVRRQQCGTHGRSGQVRKTSPPPGFDLWTVRRLLAKLKLNYIKVLKFISFL
jgi:hypothetical protein